MYASMGMTPEEIRRRVADEAKPLGIWPENWNAVRVFERAVTQWRHGPRRITGLDYTALPLLFDVLGIADDRLEVFDRVRVMESHVLNVIINRE